MGGLTACSSEDGVTEELPGGVTEAGPVVVYSVSIPATLGDDETTRAVTEVDAGEGKTKLESKLRMVDDICVYDKTKDLGAWDDNYEDVYLHADADAKTANLVGGLTFYSYFGGYNQVQTDDVLLLMYNTSDEIFRYDNSRRNPDARTYGQKGTLVGLSDYDYATAEVEITGIGGDGTDASPYTLTTTVASFTNLQSMFKLTFTGMPADFSNSDGSKGINKITIHSAKDKLVSEYNPTSDYDNDDDLEMNLGGSDGDGNGDSDDARRARKANGAGNVVYAALRFLPLDSETETDEITFTIETTAGTYIAKKTSSAGGFQNGKYYTATIDAYPQNVDLSALTGDYTALDGQVLTGTMPEDMHLTIADGATVTLNGVIRNSSNWHGIKCDGDATIILGGSSSIVSGGGGHAGIYVDSGKTLTISGTGSLIANGSTDGIKSGAGIGGCDQYGGNIVIEDGHIQATGGENAAGIGSGYSSNTVTCGDIAISGGTVTAVGGAYAAAIGCGKGYDSSNRNTCGNITISDGTVSATAGSGGGPAIGSSGANSNSGSILFIGGDVMASSNNADYPTIGNTSFTYATNSGVDIVCTVGRVVITNSAAVDNKIKQLIHDKAVTIDSQEIDTSKGCDHYNFTFFNNDFDSGAKKWTLTQK